MAIYSLPQPRVGCSKKEKPDETVKPGCDESEASPDPSPAAQAERHEVASEALGLLAGLPKNQQEVVRLKFQNGLSYQEISKITNLSVSNVGVLIHTAIKTLASSCSLDPSGG